MGAWPISSWIQSLQQKKTGLYATKIASFLLCVRLFYSLYVTHGSVVCSGESGCLVYCVALNTLKARLAKKSRGEIKPYAGHNLNPLRPEINK